MRLLPRSPLVSALVVVAAFAAGGCGDEPTRRPQPTPRASDKAALYADAALLPTRAGEKARNEVALAEEIRVALETLHGVERARVTVATDQAGAAHSAAIVIRSRTGIAPDPLTNSATQLSRAAVGVTDLEVHVQVSAPSVDEASKEVPDGNAPPALLFGVLGLGISLGLTFDRAVGILRRRRVG
ncbi:MAG: hypothetical protein ACRBN8_16575 [Nannocystales bacterium]